MRLLNENADGVAIRSRSQHWELTYSDLRSRLTLTSALLSSELKRLGIRNDLPLSITMDGSLTSILLFLTCFEIGHPTAILPKSKTGDSEQEHMRMPVGRHLNLNLFDLKTGFPFNEASLKTAIRGIETKFLNPKTSLVLFTSGTLSQPKAVQVAGDAVLQNTLAVVESLRFERVREQHLFLPLHYSFGLLGQLLPALSCGTTTVLYSGFQNFVSAFETVDLQGMISGVPSQLQLLVRWVETHKRKPQSKVSHIVSAGGHLSLETRKSLRRTFPDATLSSNYGLTEAGPRVLSFDSSDPEFWTEATGRAVRGVKVSTTQEGELLVESPRLMLGYLGVTDRDIPNQSPFVMRTGDRASIDSSGLVSVLGRMDSSLKIHGNKIDPEELEHQIRKEFAVNRCLVFELLDEAGHSILCVGFEKFAVLPDPDQFWRRMQSRIGTERPPKRAYRLDFESLFADGKPSRRLSLTDVTSCQYF